jgi:hypothetical protein
MHALAEDSSDRSGICVVTVGRNSVRCDAGHRLRRPKEAFGSGQIAVLAQHHVDQGAITINRAV